MPSYKMGTGSRAELSGGKESSAKPGPGTYNQDKILGTTAPNFGFGTENRPDVGGGKDGKLKPGPGTY